MSLLDDDDNKLDVYQILAKTLYFGMFVNVLLPMALLMLCYYIDQNYFVQDKTGDMADSLFIIFGLLALIQAGLALWRRGRNLHVPMVRRLETIQHDLMVGVLKASRPIFIMIAAISIYGYLYFYLTGRFKETVFLVLFSFLVFQVVRPRHAAIKKVVRHQKAIAEKGELLR
jgi:LPXTG-motif cell wall-anchored protein